MGKYAFANKNDEQERNEDNNSYFRFKDTWMATAIIRQELERRALTNLRCRWRTTRTPAVSPTSPAPVTPASGRYYYGDHTNGVAWRLISQGKCISPIALSWPIRWCGPMAMMCIAMKAERTAISTACAR
jgi:carbohydrate-specific outer membrane porin